MRKHANRSTGAEKAQLMRLATGLEAIANYRAKVEKLRDPTKKFPNK
jgi:hypothetical protein